jgi:hypothetical protein
VAPHLQYALIVPIEETAMPRATSIVLSGILGLLLLFAAKGAADDGEPRPADERVLLQAGVGTSGPELLDFFRKRTVSDERRRRVADVIQLLGDPELKSRILAARELISVGKPAMPGLRAAAKDRNPEIAPRAQECLTIIQAEADLPAAALRLLVAARPAGASQVLLDYLPSAADERLEEEICAALGALGAHAGRLEPALVAAAQSNQPLQRMAAAEALVRAGGEYRAVARRLLEDREARVRWHTARTLLTVRDKSAVPGLIGLLDNGPPALARQADDLLCQIAGNQAPAAGLGTSDAASRQRCRDGWLAWWQTQARQIDLARVNIQPDADPEVASLIEQATQLIRAALTRRSPEPKDIEKARIAAGMIAVYAQTGPGGAATPLRATRRDAALRLMQTIQAEQYDQARQQVEALAALNPDHSAALGRVPLGKHVVVTDVMGQFGSERAGGLGIETRLLKLEAATKKTKALPDAALTRNLMLDAAHIALAADVLKEHRPRKAPQEWAQHTQGMRQAAVALAQAAKAKDGQVAWNALQRLNESCSSCHATFR